jgi:hypothetical protein
MEIGASAISFLVATWEGHLTPAEAASMADKASKSREETMVSKFVSPFVWPLDQGCQMACILSDQKSQFESILDGLGMEKVGILFGHLKYTLAFWYIVLPFGNLEAIWVCTYSSVLVY